MFRFLPGPKWGLNPSCNCPGAVDDNTAGGLAGAFDGCGKGADTGLPMLLFGAKLVGGPPKGGPAGPGAGRKREPGLAALLNDGGPEAGIPDGGAACCGARTGAEKGMPMGRLPAGVNGEGPEFCITCGPGPGLGVCAPAQGGGGLPI